MSKKDIARRVELVSELVAAIEDIITDQTGRNVLRSGRDGSLTADGGTVARMIEDALAETSDIADVVATVEELDALEARATILDPNGHVWTNDGDGTDKWGSVTVDDWHGGPKWLASGGIGLPVSVLHRPTP